MGRSITRIINKWEDTNANTEGIKFYYMKLQASDSGTITLATKDEQGRMFFNSISVAVQNQKKIMADQQARKAAAERAMQAVTQGSVNRQTNQQHEQTNVSHNASDLDQQAVLKQHYIQENFFVKTMDNSFTEDSN